eukprot:1359270-Amorphochlora_amoeboformis.AAC.2
MGGNNSIEAQRIKSALSNGPSQWKSSFEALVKVFCTIPDSHVRLDNTFPLDCQDVTLDSKELRRVSSNKKLFPMVMTVSKGVDKDKEDFALLMRGMVILLRFCD